MADVFISYARVDRRFAEQLDSALRARGLTTWWDSSLIAGDTWNEAIRSQLRTARCVVVIWSTASWNSRWVQAEAQSGFDRNVLVAGRADNVHLEPPFNIVQTADMRTQEGLNQVITGVARKLDLISMAAPAATRPPQPEGNGSKRLKDILSFPALIALMMILAPVALWLMGKRRLVLFWVIAFAGGAAANSNSWMISDSPVAIFAWSLVVANFLSLFALFVITTLSPNRKR